MERFDELVRDMKLAAEDAEMQWKEAGEVSEEGYNRSGRATSVLK